MARNNPGFFFRDTQGRFVRTDITFGGSDSASFAPPKTYLGYYRDMDDGGLSSMSSFSSPSKSSPSYSPHQSGGNEFSAHTLYHSLRGVSSMAPLFDAALSPAIYKNAGDYSLAKPSESISVTKEIYCVDDIEEVAKIYEGKGYAVSEEYFGNPLQIHNRLFYDVIQCDEILFSDIASEDIVSDIMGRFGNGIRLWHGDETDPTKLVCENYYVKLGQLFFKDNTEV